MPKHVLIT